jgi:REP element-mobilizing transposase RayT
MARSHHYRYGDLAYPHFVTCTAVGWLPVFTRPANVETLFDSLRFLRRERAFRLLGYVVMENHLHLIARSDHLPRDLADFKSFTARQIIDRARSLGDELLLEQLRWYRLRHKDDRDFQLWQEGNHPQQIDSEAMLRQKLAYIHDNPVKRGYIADPTHWRYSSARNYAGLSSLIDIDSNW